MFMKGNFQMTDKLAKGYVNIIMVPNMRVIG